LNEYLHAEIKRYVSFQKLILTRCVPTVLLNFPFVAETRGEDILALERMKFILKQYDYQNTLMITLNRISYHTFNRPVLPSQNSNLPSAHPITIKLSK
ncbi:unnamed protein product, partial [Tenebrio molitor]